MEKNIIKVRSTKDISIAISLLIIGLLLVTLPLGTGVNLSGFLFIVTAAISALMLKSGYKDSQTGDIYTRKEIYFPQTMRTEILSAIGTNPESITSAVGSNANNLKMEIYINRTKEKALLRLFEYIPYKYEQCSEVYEHEIRKVDKLIN